MWTLAMKIDNKLIWKLKILPNDTIQFSFHIKKKLNYALFFI